MSIWCDLLSIILWLSSHNFMECISLSASLISLGSVRVIPVWKDDFQHFCCKVSHSFRCSFELVISNDEIAWLISLSSERFTSSKKEYFIFGGNLKLQKQGNKTGSRSQINVLQSSLLLISFEAVFTSYACNSTSFQEFQREITSLSGFLQWALLTLTTCWCHFHLCIDGTSFMR